MIDPMADAPFLWEAAGLDPSPYIKALSPFYAQLPEVERSREAGMDAVAATVEVLRERHPRLQIGFSSIDPARLIEGEVTPDLVAKLFDFDETSEVPYPPQPVITIRCHQLRMAISVATLRTLVLAPVVDVYAGSIGDRGSWRARNGRAAQTPLEIALAARSAMIRERRPAHLLREGRTPVITYARNRHDAALYLDFLEARFVERYVDRAGYEHVLARVREGGQPLWFIFDYSSPDPEPGQAMFAEGTLVLDPVELVTQAMWCDDAMGGGAEFDDDAWRNMENLAPEERAWRLRQMKRIRAALAPAAGRGYRRAESFLRTSSAGAFWNAAPETFSLAGVWLLVDKLDDWITRIESAPWLRVADTPAGDDRFFGTPWLNDASQEILERTAYLWGRYAEWPDNPLQARSRAEMELFLHTRKAKVLERAVIDDGEETIVMMPGRRYRMSFALPQAEPEGLGPGVSVILRPSEIAAAAGELYAKIFAGEVRVFPDDDLRRCLDLVDQALRFPEGADDLAPPRAELEEKRSNLRRLAFLIGLGGECSAFLSVAEREGLTRHQLAEPGFDLLPHVGSWGPAVLSAFDPTEARSAYEAWQSEGDRGRLITSAFAAAAAARGVRFVEARAVTPARHRSYLADCFPKQTLQTI